MKVRACVYVNPLWGVPFAEARLWTPRILKDLLEMAGFKVHMFPWMKPRETITESTWKMMVKCERNG